MSGSVESAPPCSDQASFNQGPLLIISTCVPADIRYSTDLSLLHEARKVAEKMINAMHPQIKETFGNKPRTYRKNARQQFLAVSKKKRPCINKIRKSIQQQLHYLERNLQNTDALILSGAYHLAAGRN
jgi:IS5 family transposase